MNKVIVLRYGEIYLKGNNRGIFEKVLITNIRQKIKKYSAEVKRISGRYIVYNYIENLEQSLIEELTKIFGLVSISPSVELPTDKQEIELYIRNMRLSTSSFRVSVTRADKKFPVKSTEYSAYLGELVLESNNIKVDLQHPETNLEIDIRENGYTYIMSSRINCVGGMPVGTGGKGLLLLSGGIDSPVAGFMMAKRGMTLSALHFHSYPYTSLQAKEKVCELKNILENYVGKIKLFVCSFTTIQEEIHKHCAPEFMIAIMRRIMMRIAEKLCSEYRLQAIITGESLAQVASQTIESITSTNSVLSRIPALRPCIGMDKQEIIEISERIGTYQTSILPYEDCCTVFLPKNPVIKPKINDVIKEESKLNLDELISNALSTVEIIEK